MEPLKNGDTPALVSNLEVMELLQERMATRQPDKSDGSVKSTKGPFHQRDWIEQTVLEYLKSSPVGSSDLNMGEMPKLIETLRLLRLHELTTAETLQVLNHLPTSLVELHLLIEDLEKRVPDEEKQMEFLKLICQYSGREVDEQEESTDDMEE